jgi:hypothetical protein
VTILFRYRQKYRRCKYASMLIKVAPLSILTLEGRWTHFLYKSKSFVVLDALCVKLVGNVFLVVKWPFRIQRMRSDRPRIDSRSANRPIPSEYCTFHILHHIFRRVHFTFAVFTYDVQLCSRIAYAKFRVRRTRIRFLAHVCHFPLSRRFTYFAI